MARFPLVHLLLPALLVACRLPDDEGPSSKQPVPRGDTQDTVIVDTTDTDSDTARDCTNPTSQLDGTGAPTGFEQCEDGAVNRVEAVSVAVALNGPTCDGTEDVLNCTTDAQCGVGERCLHSASFGPVDSGTFWGRDTAITGTSCDCTAVCSTDQDCGAGKVCLSPAVSPGLEKATCVSAACGGNDDCESGECGLAVWSDDCGWNHDLACRTADDACRTDADCDDEACGVGYDGSYTCQEGCAIGRPLLQGHDVVRADVVNRGDWAREVAPSLDLPAARRAELASHWTQVARMEHASVASFARHTLQLMALGAPADLVAEVQQAAADEVEHARVAFALASAYAGQPVGPGPLRSDLTLETTPRVVLAQLIREACVCETLGVAEALADAEAADDPVVAEVLRRIAGDELRHAALAWRTLRWMIRTFDLGQVASEQLTAEVERAAAGALAAAGPYDPHRATLHRETALAVLLPCLRAVAA